MSMIITLDLSDRDLKHFTGLIESAREAAADKSNDEIAQAATDLLLKAQGGDQPGFVKDRLLMLDTMIAMLRDTGWALGGDDAEHVRSALAYFAKAADTIPDHVPLVGFLDDAVLIELCARELRHEIDAYDDFCDFRQREAERRSLDPQAVGRADWLSARREELQDRMHRRRSREGSKGPGVGYGTSSGYASNRSYVSNNVVPLFRCV